MGNPFLEPDRRSAEDRPVSAAGWWLDWGWVPLFLLTIVTSLLARPLMPVDETRYLGVAWEMWQTGSWVLPVLNGEPYGHKPPLLFWLIHAGWAVFGVNEITARLVAPAFALGSLFLLRLVARGLWPDVPLAGRLAPWILLGCVYWLGFATMVMFDQLVVFFVLLGVLGLVRLGQSRRIGWSWLFLATGLGVLAKGPFVLIYLVPLTVAAPWWAGVPRSWGWFIRAGVVGFLGSSLGLIWALWAAHIGGPALAEELLWKQMVGRTVEAFDHAEPFYYHLLYLPLLMLPWLLVTASAALRTARSGPRWNRQHAPGVFRRHSRLFWLALAWVLVPLLLLSSASGKQPHYLLPMLPALALLLSLWLARHAEKDLKLGARWVAGMWGLLAAVIVLLARGSGSELASLVPVTTVVLVGVALLFVGSTLWRRRPVEIQVPHVTVATILALLLLHLAFQPLRPAFDLQSFARELGELQAEGRTLGFIGKYRAEYDFHGRLADDIRVLGSEGKVAAFCEANRDGVVVMRIRGNALPAEAIASTRFRSKYDVALPCPQAAEQVV